MTQLTFDDLATAKLPQLISRKESFEVVGLSGKLIEAVRLVESKIEVTGLTCRVYTVRTCWPGSWQFCRRSHGGIRIALGDQHCCAQPADLQPRLRDREVPGA